MIYGHPQQQNVAAFHEALDIPVETTPALRRVDLRIGLIAEEAREVIEAAEAGDLVGAIDGLCDLIYVCYGAALEWGIDLAPFWDEVQMSNMKKVGGPTRADGKKLKPEGWQPPNIVGVLQAQIAKAPAASIQGSDAFRHVVGRSSVAGL